MSQPESGQPPIAPQTLALARTLLSHLAPDGWALLLDRELHPLAVAGSSAGDSTGSRDQPRSGRLSDILPTVIAVPVRGLLRQAVAGTAAEATIRDRSGTYLLSAKPLPDDSGQTLAVLLVVHARAAGEDPGIRPLWESDDLFRAVWNAAGDAMALSDANGIVHAVNPSYCALYGYEAEAVVGKHFAVIFPEDRRAWAAAGYRETFAAPQPASSVRSVVRRRDGSERTVEAGYTFLKHDDRRVAMLSVVRDITDRVRAETALQVERDRLQVLADTASSLLMSEDPPSIVAEVFRRLAERFGLEIYLFYRLDEHSRLLKLDAWGGISAQQATALATLKWGEAVCGAVASSGRDRVLEQVQQSTAPEASAVRSLGVQAYASHALVAYGRVIGTLSFGTRHRSRFTVEELALLRAVSNQVAIAVENARLRAMALRPGDPTPPAV